MGGLGPVRAGMTVEQVLALADFSGLERQKPAGECWYLRYGSDFALMIIDGRVARVELQGASKLGTFAGARIGTTEAGACRPCTARGSTCSRTNTMPAATPSR